MKIVIEFTNLSKALAGVKELEMALDPGTTFGQIVERLGVLYPAPIGILIEPGGKKFMNSNMFIINGDMATPAFIMDECPKDGDRLVLMTLVTGG
jgi:molybdopterin converting factor small subunit